MKRLVFILLMAASMAAAGGMVCVELKSAMHDFELTVRPVSAETGVGLIVVSSREGGEMLSAIKDLEFALVGLVSNKVAVTGSLALVECQRIGDEGGILLFMLDGGSAAALVGCEGFAVSIDYGADWQARGLMFRTGMLVVKNKAGNKLVREALMGRGERKLT